MGDPKQDDGGELRRGMRILAISWVMAGAIVLGGYLGWLVDDRVIGGEFPLMTFVGLGAGILGGGYYAYRTIMKALTE